MLHMPPCYLKSHLKTHWIAFMAALTLTLSGCGGSEESPLSPMAQVGAKAFADASLSASGRQSCASCHAMETGHAAPNALAAQAGGANLQLQGLRNSQTLRYLATNTPFHIADDGTPTGGFFWDGRADSLSLQAAGPLLGAREMANPDKAAVVAKIARSDWAQDFKAVFGANILDHVDLAFEKLTLALQQFQLEDAKFNGYTSKFDAVLRGQAQLSDQEARGLVLFNDPAKGNCASCHPSSVQADGRPPLFTDFTYDALGVPRNLEIAANADLEYFDLGLCGRPELSSQTQLCGAFKVPTLRNVALRKSFFHNGKFKTLKDALTFYVQRDTQPEKWYALNQDHSVNKFDDLPAMYKGNVNTSEAPYNRNVGDAPALSDAEIDDVIAFLGTLTDNWVAPR